MNQILGCTYVAETGESLPLVTVTADDLAAWGCDGEPQEGAVELAKFLDDGCYHVRRAEGDAYSFIAYEGFVNDPEGMPLMSASGKFEIYSQAKADAFNGTLLSTQTVKPYPHYIDPIVGWESTFSDWDNQVKGEYPYNVYNPHYLRRSHSVLDNNVWLRETWPNPVYLNAQDAAEKGIEAGDAVCIYNANGKIVRTACILNSLMPGMVGIPHGAWVDLDENEEYDLGGADNVLCGPEVTASGVSSYNNYNVNFEKYEGEVVPDCAKPQRIIEL